jgi:hypothetical protein
MVPFYDLHKLNELMYDLVINSEFNLFTIQNWNALKSGGWIDSQASDMEAHRQRMMQKKSE